MMLPELCKMIWSYLRWTSPMRRTRPSRTLPALNLKKTTGGRISKSPSPKSPGRPATPKPLANDELYKRVRSHYHKIDGKRNSDVQTALIPQIVADGPAQRFPPTRTLSSKGLENRGNMCYRNAVLQCLLHVPRFYRILGKVHKDCFKETSACAVCGLQNLAQRYYNDPPLNRVLEVVGPVTAIRDLHTACNACSPIDQPDLKADFASGAQSDPYDFLLYLWDQMRSLETKNDDASSADLFEVGREVKWRCHECGHSGHEDPKTQTGFGMGFDVSITSLPRGARLDEYLKKSLQYDKRARCDNGTCKHKDYRRGEKEPMRSVECTVTALPEILVVRLLRYTYTRVGRSMYPMKENRHVEFGEYLNLGRYTADKNDEMYRLDGVVSHKGRNVSSGHYIATVRTAEGFDFETINDNRSVTQKQGGTFQEMLKPDCGTDEGFLPYILVYSKM